MNPDTRVSVHCYEGDGHQVRDALTLYLHHGCPVTVFSPVDSPVMVDGVVCRHVGRREGSIMEVSDLALGGTEDVKRTVTGGKIANERQRDQMLHEKPHLQRRQSCPRASRYHLDRVRQDLS